MTIEQVERLLDAGFTRDEIVLMFDGETVKRAVSEEPQTEEQGAVQEEAQQEEAKPIEENKLVADNRDNFSDLGKRLDGIESSISEMVKSFQMSNLRNDSFGGMPDTLEDRTDKILASIIRPQTEKE